MKRIKKAAAAIGYALIVLVGAYTIAGARHTEIEPEPIEWQRRRTIDIARYCSDRGGVMLYEQDRHRCLICPGNGSCVAVEMRR